MNPNKDTGFILELHGKKTVQSPKRLVFMAFLHELLHSGKKLATGLSPLLKESHFIYKRACFNSSLSSSDQNLSFQHLGEHSDQRHPLANW